MRYLLDTNVVSEIAKTEPATKCLTWLADQGEECAVSSITLAELRYGIERRVSGKEKSRLEKAYAFLVQDYRSRIFDFDFATAAAWGLYAAELEGHYGSGWWKNFDLRDTQIAAIAREFSLIIVTRNVKDFPFCNTTNPFI
jgi:toxin FitB